MQNVTIALDDRPGALAEMGEALVAAGISIEGGGAWVVAGSGVGEFGIGQFGIGQFLFADGQAARRALEAANIRVLAVREVVVQRLSQDEPGQLGKLCRKMAEAGVNIEVQYSDHDHQLVLVVDDIKAAQAVADEWSRQRGKASG